MTPTIDPERLAKLASMPLLVGSHDTVADGLCAMEAAAWLAGERHSDAPQCVCPVVAAASRRLNDRIADTALRTEVMRPIVVAAVGTRATRAVEIKRAFVAADFACREAAPMALDPHGLGEWAAKLRALASVVDVPTAIKARDLCLQARNAAAMANIARADAADAVAAAAAYADADAADAVAAAAAYADADAADAVAYAAAYAAYAAAAAYAAMANIARADAADAVAAAAADDADAVAAYAAAAAAAAYAAAYAADYAYAYAAPAAAHAAEEEREPMSRACAAMILRMCAVTE